MATISGLGRLGRNPTMKYTPAGTAQTNFSVALNTGYGENKSTVWLNLVCWGAQAETMNKYLAKGSRISFTAEITRVSGYSKQDESIGVNLDAKLLTCEFVDGIEKQTDGTPFDAQEPEEF